MSCRVQVQIWWLWFTAQTLHQFEREIYLLFTVSTAMCSARIRFSIINMIRYVVYTVGYYREVPAAWPGQGESVERWRGCGRIIICFRECIICYLLFTVHCVLLFVRYTLTRLLFHFRRHFSTINHMGWWGESMKMNRTSEWVQSKAICEKAQHGSWMVETLSICNRS